MKQEKTNNELIAEFMELVPCECNWCLPERVKKNRNIFYSTPEKVSVMYPMHSEMILIDDAPYATSWDWLMPVVQKIDEFEGVVTTMKGSKFTITYGKRRFSCHTISKINSTYRVVVEFIKWYNSQKP